MALALREKSLALGLGAGDGSGYVNPPSSRRRGELGRGYLSSLRLTRLLMFVSVEVMA